MKQTCLIYISFLRKLCDSSLERLDDIENEGISSEMITNDEQHSSSSAVNSLKLSKNLIMDDSDGLEQTKVVDDNNFLQQVEEAGGINTLLASTYK